MIRSNRLCTRLVAAVGTLGLLGGCSGATAPDNTPPASTAGTYDFTTSLQTITQPSSACSSSCTYATYPVATGASLAGTLVMLESFRYNGMVVHPVDSFVLSEADCYGGGQCFNRVGNYPAARLFVANDTLAQMASFYSNGEGVYFDRAVVAGDSIAGTLRWVTAFGQSTRFYTGKYRHFHRSTTALSVRGEPTLTSSHSLRCPQQAPEVDRPTA
jgi:hypothetical protein